MEETIPKDPVEVLILADNAYLLITVPAAVLAILLVIAAVVIFRRRKQEKKWLETDLTGQKSAIAYESDDELEIPELSLPPTPAASSAPEPRPSLPPPPTIAIDITEVQGVDDGNWLSKLRHGLTKTRDSFSKNLASLFSGGKVDAKVLEQVHEVLYRADLGVKTTDRLVECLRKEDSSTWESVRDVLKAQITEILQRPKQALRIPKEGPWVILIVGVNGVGKTTTVGKLAAHFIASGKSTLVCAADTFRAAAIDQLQVWADRLGCEIVRHNQGSDPAAVAFDAVKAAKARNRDVVLIDTAGRLHNKNELMEELSKIRRVLKNEIPEAPHEVWLVIDATTGQNAFIQVKAFLEVVAISGLVVTKLDGTAKGGVIIGITDQFSLPIRYIGIGEKAADLRAFKPEDFVDSLFH